MGKTKLKKKENFKTCHFWTAYIEKYHFKKGLHSMPLFRSEFDLIAPSFFYKRGRREGKRWAT